MPLSKAQTDAAYAAHRRDQIRHIAHTTSVEDRIHWLEEALSLNAGARLRGTKRRSYLALAPWEGNA